MSQGVMDLKSRALSMLLFSLFALHFPAAAAEWRLVKEESAFKDEKSTFAFYQINSNALTLDCKDGEVNLVYTIPTDTKRNWMKIAEAGSHLLFRADDEPVIRLAADYVPFGDTTLVVVQGRPDDIVDRLTRTFRRIAVAIQSGDDIWGEQQYPYANTPIVMDRFVEDCP